MIKPRAVTVGGLDELLIDVSVPPTYTKICPWSEGRPVVPLIIGGGTLSSLHHVALRELSVQLIALAWRGTNVTIEVTSVHDQVPARRYLRLTQPILESLHFAT